MIGEWRVDPRADEIESGGHIVKLEPLRMRLLMALAERAGEAVLSNELLDTVWKGVIVTPSSLYQSIAQLRQLLGDSVTQPRYIETVPRKGYRLVAPVRPLVAEEPKSELRPLEVFPVLESQREVNIGKPPDPLLRDRRLWLVAGATASVAVAAGSLWQNRGRTVTGTVRIAVRQFTDPSPGASDRALAVGLATDLIRAFERHAQVRVLAPESSIDRAPADLDNAGIAVDYAVSGNLNRIGSGIRLAVQILQQPGDRLYWEQAYERSLDALSQLGSDIAQAVFRALRLPAPSDVNRRVDKATQAHELYLLGNNAALSRTTDGYVKAREFYEQGINADPDYPLNYYGMGRSWIAQASSAGGIDQRSAYARATPLFEKALRLDPTLPEVLTAQGALAIRRGQYDEARALLTRAFTRSPGYAIAVVTLGVAEFDDGWPRRAAQYFEQAAGLNPLSSVPLERLGISQATAGLWREAEASYKRAVALEPRYPNAHWAGGIAGYAEGALDRAVGAYRDALAIEARRSNLWIELAFLYLDLGAPAAAIDAMERAENLLPKSASGRVETAYAWLLKSPRDEPPPIIALEALPEDSVDTIDGLMIRAMAGLPLDRSPLDRAIAAARARETPTLPRLWSVFMGKHSLIDLAYLLIRFGDRAAAAPWMETARNQLDRYERQGNVGHALSFHRVRLSALSGDVNAALTHLEKAVTTGCRRGWRLRLDPSFEALRNSPRFAAALDRIDADTARQRTALKIQ